MKQEPSLLVAINMSNYALYTQIICIVLLIILFIYVVRKYPLTRDVKKISISALLVTLAVTLNAVSISFGEVFKISFVYLPLLLSGVILSPSYAYLVGFSMDMIGLIITPTNYPFFGFTLSHVLASTLPAIFFQKSIKLDASKVMKIIDLVFVIFAVVASLFLLTLNTAEINHQMINLDLKTKILSISGLILVCMILIVVVHLIRKKLDDNSASDLAKWMIVVVTSEVLINLILTPLWLDVMYGLPWLVSMFLRVIKAIVMIPLNITIGYSLLKVMRRFN